MLVKGEFYKTLVEKRKDTDELKECMEKTVQKFLENETYMNKPGMLLGKIQGQARRYYGVFHYLAGEAAFHQIRLDQGKFQRGYLQLGGYQQEKGLELLCNSSLR